MNTRLIGIAVAVLLLSYYSITSTLFNQAYAATIIIKNDKKGGNCTSVGTWNSNTKTCTLTKNLSGAIIIDSSGIVLNGNGRTITGNNIGEGVTIAGQSGITVKNLKVRNFEVGIFIASGTNNILEGNSVTSSVRYGILLDSSNGNTLKQNTANSNNRIGIALLYSDNNKLDGNTAVSNSGKFTQAAIYLESSSRNTLTGNTASNNPSAIGIVIVISEGNTLKDNIVNSNGHGGIFLGVGVDQGSAGNTLTGNTVSNNGVGISLDHANENNLIGNTVNSNKGNGITVEFESSGNILRDNTANSNYDGVVLIGAGNGNTLNHNTANSNSQFGFRLLDSGANNLFTDNNCLTNGVGGSSPSGLCSPQP